MCSLSDDIFEESARSDNITSTKSKIFLLQDEIMNSYKKGYSIKEIWRALRYKQEINVGYVQFYNLFKKLKNKKENNL